jgi:hypothetical protein
LTDDEVRVVAATDTAVVASERPGNIIALVLQIEAQNGTAHVDIGRYVRELIAAHPQTLGPERHDLHEANRPGGGHRPTVKTALDRHQSHDEPCRQACLADAVRLAVNDLQHVQALSFSRHELAQAWLHHFVPDSRVIAVGKAFGLADGPFDDRAQFRIALLIGARDSAARKCGYERKLSGANARE